MKGNSGAYKESLRRLKTLADAIGSQGCRNVSMGEEWDEVVCSPPG